MSDDPGPTIDQSLIGWVCDADAHTREVHVNGGWWAPRADLEITVDVSGPVPVLRDADTGVMRFDEEVNG